jgi:YegS/Rv2252/BmrU family lipid kinase
MDQTVVIINPMSGTGANDPVVRGNDRAAIARATLDGLGVRHRIQITERAGHAAELARAAVADGAPVICVWGGDGTMNEVASAIAFSPVPLGVIPGGSGNGFARELGFSMKPARAITQIIEGTERVFDAGEIDGHLFFNVAGLGFDAHVSRCFNERGLRRGFFAYVTTSFVELFRYQPHAYAIALDGETIERTALMIVVANSAQYGNGARIAPHAKPDDGRLELVIVAGTGPIASLWRSRRLYDGKMAQEPTVQMRSVEALRISSGNGPLWFHVDGEAVRGNSSIEVRVRPKALRVRVPKGAS